MTRSDQSYDDTNLSRELLNRTGNRELAEALSVAVSAANAKPNLEFHQGTVLEWNSTTGTNTIRVLGTEISDVPSLTTGDNVLLFEGDVVALLRYKTTYFVLGRITPAGTGGSLGLRSALTGPSLSVSNTAYSGSVFDPTITDIQIGSSQRALVFVRAIIDIVGGDGYIGVRAYGPSGLTFDGYDTAMLGTTSETVTSRAYITGTAMFDPASGIALEPGVNEIGLVYRVANTGGGSVTFSVASRQIIVIPY